MFINGSRQISSRGRYMASHLVPDGQFLRSTKPGSCLKHAGWKQKLKENFTPTAVQAFMRYHRAAASIKEAKKRIPNAAVAEATMETAKRQLKHDLWASATKAIGSGIFYQSVGMTYGVDARDYNLNFSAQEAWANTSRPSVIVARFFSNLIPAHKQEAAANMVIPAEWALSAVRMCVEQKVWQKFGITPDPAGTLLTPYMAGVLEFAYKATIQYPQDAQSRLAVGLVGIYGNLVRMANAGLIFAIGTLAGRIGSKPGQ